MDMSDHTVLVGHIVEEQQISLEQLCQSCATERQHILALVEEGVIEAAPEGGQRFSGTALRRARVALRLQRDFGIGAPGVALVMDLLERVEVLERRLGGS